VSDNPNAFKLWIDRALLGRMADAIHGVYPKFDRKKFIALAPELDPLELKPRVRLVRDRLQAQLPENYAEALRILMNSTAAGKLKGFDLWPYTEFVQLFGIDDPKRSLPALQVLTQLFTSEFAIRPFLIKYPRESLAFLEKCAVHSNVHVRRWASEGSRPLLPWGERLHAYVQDPRPTLALLEVLKHDPELYVRKSVANHLNDIAKHHPEKVIAVLKKWKKASRGEHEKKVEWTIRRALRTLIKNGDPGALGLVGATSKVEIVVSDLKLNRSKFRIGDRLEFAFRIRSRSKKPQTLIIDYKVHFVKANQSTSPKVFKLKTVELSPGEGLEVLKTHPLKKITTRRYHSGIHLLELQINGRAYGKLKWTLKV